MGPNLDYHDRLKNVLDLSWLLFKQRFVDGRHRISTEAPFQHHFARLIGEVGACFCSKRDDVFYVDLETKSPGLGGKYKYLDITCGFSNQQTNCAIELKFKTAKQSAQDYGRIDMFVDIAALEHARSNGFDFGRFYMITDSTAYVRKSKKGVGTVFTTHHDAATDRSSIFHYPLCKGKEDVKVLLKDSYLFQWEEIGGWYFLQLQVL